ncbi:hypothetical protein [Scytonema sp. PCC 10023]|uniref:hypothetical protein n=1 Tax=Scytonema sp. PCC 10023 TaxID=1680591 RepID=UPI0039C5C669
MGIVKYPPPNRSTDYGGGFASHSPPPPCVATTWSYTASLVFLPLSLQEGTRAAARLPQAVIHFCSEAHHDILLDQRTRPFPSSASYLRKRTTATLTFCCQPAR